MDDLEKIIADAPDNFVIQNALIKCYEVLSEHESPLCSISGGGDSDVMLDMIVRCGGKDKTHFVFFDTGLEYQATHEHIDYLNNKYNIQIEKVRAAKPIPISVKTYGAPFWSKYASEMIHRLQINGFKWEDGQFDELIKRYPTCHTALRWWCNEQGIAKGTQFLIKRAPFLKEYIIENNPDFEIHSMCCEKCKKAPAKKILASGKYDLNCLGIRKNEGGIRSVSFNSCFSHAKGIDTFRPVFWFSDADKEEYCSHYDVIHSRCYTEYGLLRTGCTGCPFGKRFEDELAAIEKYEPKLYKAAVNVFGKSYDYTRGYMQFRNKMKEAISTG